MAIRIRLQRFGAKKKPYYRIVVSESQTARDGKVIDSIGTYDPHTDPPLIKVDHQKLQDWLSKGALPSEKTDSILKKAIRATPQS